MNDEPAIRLHSITAAERLTATFFQLTARRDNELASIYGQFAEREMSRVEHVRLSEEIKRVWREAIAAACEAALSALQQEKDYLQSILTNTAHTHVRTAVVTTDCKGQPAQTP